MFHCDKNQKGISIYFIFMILVIVFGISLGLSNLIIIRFQIAKKIGKSVVAFYAADSGVEQYLYDIKRSRQVQEGDIISPPDCSGNACADTPREEDLLSWEVSPLDASYQARLDCRSGYAACSDFCTDCLQPEECDAPRFCILSKGDFQGTKRAIEVKY